ncbi:MAG: hypothetical protein EOP06_03130 [Proteobacteria bacterium]|nr:MAG: hypothetical protein EOP06_03130 [Pseudomonadota bacterium]
MEKKIKGAWLIHHGQKLQTAITSEFDAIGFAGKYGVLLSAISSAAQTQLSNTQINALAKANRLSPKTDVQAILDELSRQKLINKGASGIEVLGLTSQAVLLHTATVFEESQKERIEDAAVELAEMVSECPLSDKEAIQKISDFHRISHESSNTLVKIGGEIGFFDSEKISGNESLLFNGNLFKKNEAFKISAVLSSLEANERASLSAANAQLASAGCLPLETIHKVLGRELFTKLHAIGMFDVSFVANDLGKKYFVTRPAAFSKFTGSIADDALDLAKAFVTCLTYGMTVSPYAKGRIQMIEKLMDKLISGHSVGPATAIGSDYQALELKGVVKITAAQNGMFTMRLLKPEVGKLALAVIQEGNIAAEAITQMPSAAVTIYAGPEENRTIVRKRATVATKATVTKWVNDIRTGLLKK